MSTDLKVGDEVYVNAGIEPKLVFTITELVREAGQLMACGEYGCFAVYLLRKVQPAPIGPTSPTPSASR